MHSFKELSAKFEQQFNHRQFPAQPANLYDASQYILGIGGKRIRPVLAMMGNELFDTLHDDSLLVGTAIELFHNFTLIHDDIMDKAPLRRGMPTVHTKYNDATAIMAGDVMLIRCYDFLNKVQPHIKTKIINVFNKAASEVCEGQQYDMDMEVMKPEDVQYNDYVNMIGLKTSVLLAAALQMGAIIGGGSEGNQQHLYNFGKNVGIAFQMQDDYLDAFGDPDKHGKQAGGDILINKKTFLLLKALDTCNPGQKEELHHLMDTNPADKVAQVLRIFKECKIDVWSEEEKESYKQKAIKSLEEIAVVSARKKPLLELADFLLTRQH
ncbi:geranylgeranyl diphosphate synthase type II [Chitinophaga skermanii]|uniref:Geranylgeranyl diphosphate synthase type II n=1 Tax=Chitinophaga skermanii TaxID=331697 RepID=A0A327QSH4_9BACT|nr:polyprenyl synthetase family protein [Chitinophaga skermanii]RAJ06845.1 geranylgeranyl diphosphate synthase type II [Chitinophaga skermanii]